MSLIRRTEVVCDRCGLTEELVPAPFTNTRKSDVDRQLRGWSRDGHPNSAGRQDICPKCEGG